jgi:hypothetical protein
VLILLSGEGQQVSVELLAVRQVRHVGCVAVDHELAVGYEVSGPSSAGLQRCERVMVAVQYQRGTVMFVSSASKSARMLAAMQATAAPSDTPIQSRMTRSFSSCGIAQPCSPSPKDSAAFSATHCP